MSKAKLIDLAKSIEDRAKHRLPNWMISRLDSSQIDELEEMKRDNSRAEQPFVPTSIVWERLSALFEKRLHIDGIQNVENQLMNHWFSAFLPGHPKYYFYALWMLYSALKQRDHYGLFDKTSPSADTSRGVAIEVDGKILSWDYLISMESVLSIAEHYPQILTNPFTVLDLGAGWGRMGYLLKSVNPSLTYIIADIPVSLLVAQSYLPARLPTEKVFKYRGNRAVTTLTHDYFRDNAGIHFFGTQDLSRFADKSVDFFINIASFQEMTLAQVRSYFQIIDRLTCEALYIEQRYQGDEVGRSSYPYSPAWKMLLDRDITFAPRYFESLYRIKQGF